jgi:hypothetical protein
MTEFIKTERNQVRRLPKRGAYDKAAIYQIVDEALICHVGFVEEGHPFVLPTIHARLDDTLILHGAKASRMLKHIEAGHPVCVTVTLVDGLVLARSVFHHSINYRSAVLFGTGSVIEDEAEKRRALEAVTEHIMPGRWADARQPNPQELKATTVVKIPIESASAKIRVGPPGDEEEDYALPIWAGVLPIVQQTLPPIADPSLADGIPLPDYVVNYDRRSRTPVT